MDVGIGPNVSCVICGFPLCVWDVAGGDLAPAPPSAMVRVVKGTSSYQASWIAEALGENDEDGEGR
jgi:hypothetical protein